MKVRVSQTVCAFAHDSHSLLIPKPSGLQISSMTYETGKLRHARSRHTCLRALCCLKTNTTSCTINSRYQQSVMFDDLHNLLHLRRKMCGVNPAAHELPHDLVLPPHPPMVGRHCCQGHWCKLRGRVAVAAHVLLEMGQGLLASVLMKK